MVRKKKLSFILPLNVYPFDIYFSFNETDEEVKKFLRKQKISEEDMKGIEYVGCGRCVMFENNTAVIRVYSYPTTPAHFATLQHEITHYVMFLLFNTLNMPHNLDTTEAYAYLTAYITEQVYERIFSPQLKNKKQ